MPFNGIKRALSYVTGHILVGKFEITILEEITPMSFKVKAKGHGEEEELILERNKDSPLLSSGILMKLVAPSEEFRETFPVQIYFSVPPGVEVVGSRFNVSV